MCRAVSNRPKVSKTRKKLPLSCEESEPVKVYDLPDSQGHFGPYGGVFVAETLIAALEELRAQYDRYREDAEFQAEFAYELKHYVGRPSPIYHAKRWSAHLGGAQILL